MNSFVANRGFRLIMQKNFDFEIWQRFRRGDEKAFSYIFDTYHLQLFEYGRRFTLDEDLVRDSIQDLFFELASKKDKLSPTDNILFYLLKSLRIRIFGNLRKNKNHSIEVKTELTDEFFLSYVTDSDELEKEFRLDLLAEAVNELPARLKETIYLKFYKNLSNAEVAGVMQVNYQSVANNIQKAIHKLKSILQSDSDSIILFFQRYLR
ncbi:RNA polymerase sigma factor [Gaoshiqia sediminis]|uniref:Sigma-70 family RNA polymerase sigma factor n=1 Tax=Gaoshiqia sediminis TaxID=2986998 RepID=A0AA41Y428_9BACT|nr:sigma-70 family RNA polymerase sigma factor [Gaoshiqia sediminis]MCW0483081.1 sigma-70 family RNA polymerase sigma factor [Gaoshiqia sediminis]